MALPPPIPDNYDSREMRPPFVRQSPSPYPSPQEPMPRTYMVWNLVLCLGCIITGVIGLIFSSKVSQRWQAGDYEGACRASADAKLMLLASAVFGLINIPFLILYYALT